MIDELKKSATGFKDNLFILKYLWRARKSYLFLNIFISFINSVMEMGGILLFKVFLDLLTSGSKLLIIIPIVIIYALTRKLHELFFNYVYQFEAPKAKYAINRYLTEDIINKAISIDISCFDDTEFYNNYTNALAETADRAFNVLNNLSSIVYSIFSAIGLAITIALLDPFVFGLAVLIIISNSLFVNKSEKIQYERDMALTPYNRYMGYCKGVFFSPKDAKDLRLNANLSEYLKNSFAQYMKKAQELFTSKTKKLYFYSAIKTALNCFAEIILPLSYFSFRCLEGAITIGSVTALWESTRGIASTFSSFAFNFATIEKTSLYVKNLKFILEYEPKIVSPEKPHKIPSRIERIQFNDVCFRYNANSSYVLKNINISISFPEKIAFVGHNGAGKSTLIKLLLRLYDPTSGSITLNGIDIREFDLNEYRKLFATMFQDFSLFSVPISVNVLGCAVTNNDQETIVIEALKKAGVFDRIMAEKEGINCQYTKEFDDNGILLSGGEAQKIALARLFANNQADIYILDEPSSALDVESEYHFYKNLFECSDNKISFYISHRLSTTVNSDKIYFMENGKIIEHGTHEELMKSKGQYEYVFNLQAEKYRGEVAKTMMKKLNYE